MPKIKISDLKTLDIRTTTLFTQEPDATQIALHEAAHVTAALAHDVHINRIWVKTTQGSGMTTLTRGHDGHAHVCPNDPHQDCFISLVGVAWEERYGQTKFPLDDASYFNFSRPWVLDDAREFVINEYRNINACAAAILGLRDQKGWLSGIRLNAMCNWMRPQLKKRRSLYEIGTLTAQDSWVTDTPFPITIETRQDVDDHNEAAPRIHLLGNADIPLKCSAHKALQYPIGTRLSFHLQLQYDGNNDPYYKEVPGSQWNRVVDPEILCTFKAPRGDKLSFFINNTTH